MQQLKNLLKSQKTYIILLLIITGIFFYLRSVNRNLLGDEVLYLYNLNATEYYEYWASPETSLGEKISSISDVVNSQINHYFYGNGRSLVHAVEQLFSGVIGINIFYLLNTLLFLGTIYLFVNLFLNPQKYASWLFVIIAFLYLFATERKLWFSINLSPNYLLPTFLLLCVIKVWMYLQTSSEKKLIYLWLIPFLGFISGWTHEAFAIPLSGAFFLYLLFNFKEVNKKVLLLIFPLWIGTLILILSPANFSRLQLISSSGSGNFLTLTNIMLNPLLLKILPSLIIILLVLCYKRIIKKFILKNKFWIIMFCISLAFSMIAKTGSHSFTALELISLILIVKAIKDIQIFNWIYSNKIILICLTSIFVIHQCLIVNASYHEKHKQDRMILQYQDSAEGVCIYDKENYGQLINPYIDRFNLNVENNRDTDYDKSVLMRLHSDNNKQLIPLSSSDYDLLLNYDKYVNLKDNVNYSGPFYTKDGCSYAWADADSVKCEKYEFVYSPVSFSDNVPILMKVKRLMTPNSYPEKSLVGDMTEVTFKSRKFMAIKITSMRNVVDIKPVCNK